MLRAKQTGLAEAHLLLKSLHWEPNGGHMPFRAQHNFLKRSYMERRRAEEGLQSAGPTF